MSTVSLHAVGTIKRLELELIFSSVTRTVLNKTCYQLLDFLTTSFHCYHNSLLIQAETQQVRISKCYYGYHVDFHKPLNSPASEEKTTQKMRMNMKLFDQSVQ
ncbi:CLUMA_CG009784, isoform A [Clunio marinus]|uniref:CLUMA_CG009784, isoform A n=1 Tax=Clunio marinus TaxID=568069 RepID=A0A1J1I7S8_9DIPT|nr:CLUMA_CG009784, isoform A [Clunio marinus]